MTMSQKVNMALAYKNMSQAELARAVDMSPANFNKRLKTGKFSQEELEAIAAALGGVYTFGFEFPDGTKI